MFPIEHLMKCIDYNQKPLCTSLDGYKSIELIIAVHKSAQSKSTITSPLAKTNFKIHSK